MTDADTIANAELLWKLVHLVQETIHTDGTPLLVGMDGNPDTPRAALRKLADEIDPENARC